MAPVIELDGIEGVVFDLDGTLIHRLPGGGFEVEDGAAEALAVLRGSGRRVLVFTNASHIVPATIAAELRAAGLDVADDEVITPICSAIAYLQERYEGEPVVTFATEAIEERLRDEGVALVEGVQAERAAAVFVAHPPVFDFEAVEHAARGIIAGARLYTASNVPGYAGAGGSMIFSRGAMITAALAKATGARPAVLGKPSRPAVRELVRRAGIASERLAVVGDDVVLDVGLGHLGGSRTILVRSGISGAIADFGTLPANRRPHHVVGGVRELLGAFAARP